MGKGKGFRKKDEDLENKPLKKKPKMGNTMRKKVRGKSSGKTHPDDLVLTPEQFSYHGRLCRAFEANGFTASYELVLGKQICISSRIQYSALTEFCFDSSWVCVHGSYTICMVTRQALDMTRLSPGLRDDCTEKEALWCFATAVISGVECIPYDDIRVCKYEILRKCCGGQVVKPFGVVSLAQNDLCYEAEDLVSKFLKQKMDSSLAFTDYETLQAAIGAYQHICRGQVLRAEDICVTILDVPSGRFKHMDIDIITEQLEIVNGCLSRTKSLETPLVLRRPMLQTPL